MEASCTAPKLLKQAAEDGFEAIMEYNLTSAYGFSTSSALLPSGFCTVFFQSEGSLVLSKTDTYIRHKLFEFRSVYYTLANLQPQRANISKNISPCESGSFVK